MQTVVIYSGAKEPKTIVDKVASTNAFYANGAHKRMVFDYVLVMAKDGESSPSSGYLVGYSRTEQTATGDARTYAHHYYPQYGEPGLEGLKVLHTGEDSFGYWYAAILNHLSGVTIYPPNLLQYLGQELEFVPWTKYPF